VHGFQFIERHFYENSGEGCHNWLLSCTCDDSRKKFITRVCTPGIGCVSDLSRTLETEYPECIHISVSSSLIAMMDRVNNIGPLDIVKAQNENDHGYSKVQGG